MVSNCINIRELGVSIEFDEKYKYFELIESMQRAVDQDTYLLMDNLYEKNASCIDAYALFVWLKQNNYKAIYVIYKENPFYEKLKDRGELEDVIVCEENSLKGHDLYEKLFCCLIKTKYVILSFPDSLYEDIRSFVYKNDHMQLVMIGHGPVFFKTSILNFEKSDYLSPKKFNLYLVSSDKEKNLFVKAGWPANRIFNIGLPRFDWCKKLSKKEKNIFIMFTWRLDTFRKSCDMRKLKYFKRFYSLLNNSKLQELAKTEGYNVTIGIHHSIYDLAGLDLHIPKCYKIADSNNLIEYINSSDLFITDYSSIVHDFMFLNTPVIFYRLDYGDKLLGELDRYDLEEAKNKDDQVFNVFYDEEDVIKKIMYYVDNNFVLEDSYKRIEDSFFTEKKDLCKKFVNELEKYKPLSEETLSVKPFWNDVKTAICVSSSDEYLPYLCVYLKSIAATSLRKKDIIVFNRNISDSNKQKLLKCFSADETIQIRFVDPSFLFKNVNLYVSHDYFKEECYYRVAATKLLNEYSKIIFTDLDLISNDDILNLADIDMKGCPIAACVEPIWRELYMQDNKIYNTSIRKYTNDVLKLSNPFCYYNTGVVVFDVAECNRINMFDKIIDIIRKNNFLYQEQCALNVLFKDCFCTLPAVWNYELAPSLISNTYNFDFYNEYKENESIAKVFHFLGRYKPWKNPLEYKADIWWSYARKTPFYEEILARLIDFRITQRKNEFITPDITKLRQELANVHFPNINKHFAVDEYQTKMLFVLNHLGRFKAKKAYFAVKKAFAFGEKHKKYQKKYDVVKQLIRDAKEFKKGLLKI